MKVNFNFWSRKKPKDGERVMVVYRQTGFVVVGTYHDGKIHNNDYASLIIPVGVPVWTSLANFR